MLPHLFGPVRFSSTGLMMRRISMAMRDELAAAIAGRYAQGERAQRGRMLDEFTAVTGFHHKRTGAAGMPAGWPSKPLPIRRIIPLFKRRSTPREVRPSK